MASHDEAKELPVSRNDGSYSAKTTHSRDRPVFWDGRNYSAHAVRRGWAKILIFTALPEARAQRANKCSRRRSLEICPSHVEPSQQPRDFRKAPAKNIY